MIDDYGYASDEASQTDDDSWATHTHAEVLDGARQRVSRFLERLRDRLLGPRCPTCNERWYGPRTLERHSLSAHGSEI